MLVTSLMGTVLVVLKIAVVGTAVYSFVHAAMQRPDAYTATDKLTKPVWLVILGFGTVFALVDLLSPPFDVLLSAIGAGAAGVYLADVRPRLLEIQGKSR